MALRLASAQRAREPWYRRIAQGVAREHCPDEFADSRRKSRCEAGQGLSCALTPTSPWNAPARPAVLTSSALVIDGRLDDAAWSQARPQYLGTQSETRTSILLLWDKNALYAGLRVGEPAMDKLRTESGTP